MVTRDNVLSKENIPMLFMKYCIPAVIAMIISGVQGMIDGMFVGNYVSSNGLASVNIAMPFIQLIVGLSMIISIGSQSYIGLNLGKDNKEKAQNCFKTFKIIIFVSAIIITILGLTFNTQIATLLGADSILLADSATYIKFISIFPTPMCLMFYIGFINRIVGKPEKYFYGSVLSIIVNITLDYIFIAQMELGVLGAALATGLAYTSALFIVVSPMLNKENVINFFVGKFSTESIKSVLYNGSSEGINSLSIAVTTFLFNTALIQISGPEGVAAFTAINYVGALGGMLLFGISDGIGPIISYNFGTNDYNRVKQLMKLSYICNFVFGIILFSLLFFFGEQLVGLFIKNDSVLINLAVSGGKLYGISFLLSGFNILNSGYFTFIGRGLESVIVAASRGIIFVSVGIFVLPVFFGINGIWLSVPFAEFCAVIVGLLLLKMTNKKIVKTNLLVNTSSLKNYDETMSHPNEGINFTGTERIIDRIITVNRQFGSGGREVAKRLSDVLQCPYYDKELINYIAENSGVSADIISRLDESINKKYVYSFSRSFMTYSQLPLGKIKTAEIRILEELAAKTKGVYVGRCTNYILREHNPLKVFIYSSNMSFRVDRCIDKSPEILQLKSREEIAREILVIDNKRKSCYKANTGHDWDDMKNYHICIDTSEVGIKQAVEIIKTALIKA